MTKGRIASQNSQCLNIIERRMLSSSSSLIFFCADRVFERASQGTILLIKTQENSMSKDDNNEGYIDLFQHVFQFNDYHQVRQDLHSYCITRRYSHVRLHETFVYRITQKHFPFFSLSLFQSQSLFSFFFYLNNLHRDIELDFLERYQDTPLSLILG